MAKTRTVARNDSSFYLSWSSDIHNAQLQEAGDSGMATRSCEREGLSFVDGTLRPHCKLRDNAEQESTYFWYKRTNGIKFQGVVLPNGIIAHLWCPVVGRRLDSYLLRRSTLNTGLAADQLGNPGRYCTYGDSAYPNLSHNKRSYKPTAAGLTPYEASENTGGSVLNGDLG
ncbi:unnamed protein product [Discosporangium mesarthrocarpum]